MKRLLISILLSMTFGSFCIAQSPQVKSLIAIADSTHVVDGDSLTYLQALLNVGSAALQEQDFDNAISYYAKTATLAKTIEGTDSYPYMLSTLFLGEAYSTFGDYVKAIQTISQIYPALSSLHKDKPIFYYSAIDLGSSYFNLKDYRNSANYWQDAVDHLRENDVPNQSFIGRLSTLAFIYNCANDRDKAINCYEEVLDIRRKENDIDSQDYLSDLLSIKEVCDTVDQVSSYVKYNFEYADYIRRNQSDNTELIEYINAQNEALRQIGHTPYASGNFFESLWNQYDNNIAAYNNSRDSKDYTKSVSFAERNIPITYLIYGKDSPRLPLMKLLMANSYSDAGEYDKSIALSKEIISEIANSKDDPAFDKKEVYNGAIYRVSYDSYQQKNYLQAIEYQEKYLELTRPLPGVYSEKYSKELDWLELVYSHVGAYDKSIALYNDAIRYYEAGGVDESSYIEHEVRRLAGAFFSAGQYDKGLVYINKVYDFTLRKYGKDSYNCIDIRNAMGTILLSKKEYTKAFELFSENLESINSNSLLKDQAGVKVYNSLSEYYSYIKDHENTIKYAKLYVQSALKKYGRFSIEYGDALSNYSGYLNDGGYYKEAKSNAEKAYDILSSLNLTEDHNLSYSLAQIERATKNLGKDNVKASSRDIIKSMYGEVSVEHARDLSQAAFDYVDNGDLENALSSAEQAYEIHQMLGSTSIDAINSTSTFALISYLNADYEKAILLYGEILSIRGLPYDQRSSALRGKSMAHRALKEYDEAAKATSELLEISISDNTVEVEDVAWALETHATSLLDLEDNDSALECITLSIEIYETNGIKSLQSATAHRMGAELIQAKDKSKGIEWIDEAIRIMSIVPPEDYNEDEMFSLYNMAAQFVPDSLSDEKHRRFQEFISFADSKYTKESREYCLACFNFAEYLYDQEEYAGAYDYCEKSRPYWENAQFELFDIYDTGTLSGLIAMRFHDYENAKIRYEKAKSAAESLYTKSSKEYVNILELQHDLYNRTGEYLNDLTVTKEREQCLIDLYGNDSDEYAEHCITDGLTKQSILDYDGSIESFSKAMSVYDINGNDDGLFYSVMLMAEAGIDSQHYDTAGKVLTSYLERSAISDSRRCIASTMNGVALIAQHKKPEAAIIIDQAKSFYQSSDWSDEMMALYEPLYHHYLGVYYDTLEDFELANSEFDRAIDSFNHAKSIDVSTSLSILHMMKSRVLARWGRSKEAVLSSDMAVSSIEGTLSPVSSTYSNAKFNQAYTRYITGSKTDSRIIDELIKSERTQAEVLLPQMRETQRKSFWGNHVNTKNLLFSLGRKEVSTSAQYDYLLLSKNLLLNSSMDIAKAVLATKDTLLINKYAVVFGSGEIDETDKNALQQEEEIISTLIRKYGYQSNLRSSYSDIAASLPKDAYGIEFVSYKQMGTVRDTTDVEMLGALLAKNGWSKPKFINLCATEEINPVLERPYEICDYNSDLADLLFNKVWKPLLKYIKRGSQIYFSPDGCINELPIEYACIDENGLTISDAYRIHRVSSTKKIADPTEEMEITNSTLYGGLYYDVSMTEMQNQSRSYSSRPTSRGWDSRNSRSMGNGWPYLQGTKDEIEHIAGIMDKSNVATNVLTTIYGNEESFKSMSGASASVLHIATHGFYVPSEDSKSISFMSSLKSDDPDESMKRSGLVLSGANAAWTGKSFNEEIEDGVLTSHEIAKLDLRKTGLVVLSACETALGDLSADGVMGLQRAFKLAGVQTLVMSLWKVDDSATELMMTEFYANIMSGIERHESFRLAQDTVKEKYPEPYYWAGFIMLD